MRPSDEVRIEPEAFSNSDDGGTSAAIKFGAVQVLLPYISVAEIHTLTGSPNKLLDFPLDAPDTLTYGPMFFTLAAKMKGDVTIGLNRRLNNQANTLAAAAQAKKSMRNLLSIELGNEPEFYAAGSPIIPATGRTPAADGASQKSWFTALAPSVGRLFLIFSSDHHRLNTHCIRFATSFVYLQPPKWSTAGLVPMLGSAISFVKTVSGHSFIPTISVWGCWHQFGVFDELFYTKQYSVEAAAAHNAGARYFLGETNSATCGGGGISPTFGAALWIVEYALQAALNGVERLYFHQGTIGNCQYCWFIVEAPYYGAAFVSEFLGTDGQKLVMLDDGTGTLASYAVYNAAGHPVRLLIYNSAFFD
ncbi:hypothetical protein FPV67DRAFT_1664317 [Lyophyllum atratum]|nr:hypothetical protein FPV67DRAFT_1664317 [Lyophyllum atratum]